MVRVFSYDQLVIFLDSDFDLATYLLCDVGTTPMTTPKNTMHLLGLSLRVRWSLHSPSHYDHDLYFTGEETETE